MEKTMLEEWRALLLEEIKNLQAQIAPLEIELGLRREKLTAIERLLTLETQPLQAVAPSQNGSGISPRPRGKITDAAYEVLRSKGAPMHYLQLCTEVLEGGLPIPGKDPGTNLIAHIGKDGRFERVKRGTYALTEWKTKKQVGGLKRQTRRRNA